MVGGFKFCDIACIATLTRNVGRQPTGFAKLAWNVLKLTSMYAAKKKFDISGAIAFSSPIKMNLRKQNGESFRRNRTIAMENSRNGNDECKHVTTERFIVFAIATSKPLDFRVQLILTQRLNGQKNVKCHESVN